jgi:hypothetical protein
VVCLHDTVNRIGTETLPISKESGLTPGLLRDIPMSAKPTASGFRGSTAEKAAGALPGTPPEFNPLSAR